MQLQLSMTIGDLVVAASTATAIIGAYFALKHLLTALHKELTSLILRVDEHDEILGDHGEGIAALESQIFGRRRTDAHKKRRG